MSEPAARGVEELAREIAQLAALAIENDVPLLVLVYYLHEGEKLAFLEAVRRQLALQGLESRTLDPSHRPEHGIGEFYKALADAGERTFHLVGNLPRDEETGELDRRFLRYVNLHRNLVAERTLRFLICVHETEGEDFIDVAGDLWDVRSRSVWLERPAGIGGDRLWQSLSRETKTLALDQKQQHAVAEHMERVRSLILETPTPADRAALLLDLSEWLLRRQAVGSAAEVALEGLGYLTGEPTGLRQDLEQTLGWSLFLAGHLPEALEHLELSLKVSRQLGDKKREHETLAYIARVYDQWGRYDKALELLEQGLEMAREIGDREGESTALNNIAGIHRSRGRNDEALEFFERSLDIAREVGDREGVGVTLGNIGGIYLDWGRYDEARRYFEESLAVAREIGHRSEEGNALNSLGHVHQSAGRPEEARECFQESLRIARELGRRAAEGVALNSLALLYESWGRHGEALELLNESLAIRREIGDRAGEGTALHNIAQVYSCLGRHEDALEYLKQSLAISREIGDRSGEAATASVLSHEHERRGDLTRAAELARMAVAIETEIRAPDLEADRSRLAELERHLRDRAS